MRVKANFTHFTHPFDVIALGIRLSMLAFTKGVTMPVRPDGFMTADVLIDELGFPPRIISRVLTKIKPVTKRYADAQGLYYSPDTVREVDNWLNNHIDFLLDNLPPGPEPKRHKAAHERHRLYVAQDTLDSDQFAP
jgi:hypothetical protein